MFILLSLLLQSTATLTLDLDRPGIAVSPSLYGLMTEEINYSYDGGLYGELIRNRAFEDDTAQPVHWAAVGRDATIALDRDRRLKIDGNSDVRTASLRVRGGVANDGYWGIPIRPAADYWLTLWAMADAPGPISASLESPDGSEVFAESKLGGLSKAWSKLNVVLKTRRDERPTKNARLVLRTGDRTIWIGFTSLFPPTFHGRPNGNRPDLMRLLSDMKPRFLRFPGGNYLEGNTIAEHFPWRSTLGPIEARPGHRSPWGYRSTDGMGLLEFLEWCEDMHAKPLLAVFAGYALNGQVAKPGPDLQPYVQEALDEIEYVIGGPGTRWGSERARDGHPKPFPMECVEVGNEDGFDRSKSYEGRFSQFYDAIKAKYPLLQVISTTGGKDWLGQRSPINQRKPDLVDEHYYASTWDMMSMASKYDSYDRRGPRIFVGEWASQDVPEPWTNPSQKGPTPNMSCALADAAFMTGLERNSDIVRMSCYAPLLVNVNPGGRQWAVNLIGYDALTSFGSPSYYAQKLFATNLGDRTVPFTLANVPSQTQNGKSLPALFASATRDSRSGTIFLKLVNPSPEPQELSVASLGSKLVSHEPATVLQGNPHGMNSIAEPTAFAPRTKNIGALDRLRLDAYSITVVKLGTR